MSRSSKSRRSRALMKKRLKQSARPVSHDNIADEATGWASMSTVDKRYLIGFGVASLAITTIYFWMGGRNIFMFPALLCLSVGARKYWNGPLRRFAE